MWAPVCAVLGPQGAGLPGARFVTGGDKGTDFSIMNRPGAALGKPFFTCRSSKKQQGEVVFSFPSNAGGGGGGVLTRDSRPSLQRQTPREPTAPHGVSRHTASPPPRPPPPARFPRSMCQPFSHAVGERGASPRGRKSGSGERGALTPPGLSALWPEVPGGAAGEGGWQGGVAGLPCRVTQPPPGALAAGVARVLVGSQGLQTTVTLPSLIDKRRAALPC